MSESTTLGRASPPRPVNVYGRRPGRGLRPWLLLPKLVAVGMLLGGLAASVVLCGHVSGRMVDGTYATLPLWSVDLLRLFFLTLVVPGAALAMLFGVLLTWMHGPGLMLRQRWLQVKLLFLALAAPTGHIMMVMLLARARAAAEAGASDPQPIQQFGIMAMMVLAGVIVLATLGRHKPRFGQNRAHAFARNRG